MRTENFSTNGPPVSRPRRSICIKRRTITSGSPTASPRRSSSSTWTAIFYYEWGSQGDWPGALWNVHGMSVDQEGNLYLAEVNNGRAEKFRPRAGANPALLVGKPVYSAWK